MSHYNSFQVTTLSCDVLQVKLLKCSSLFQPGHSLCTRARAHARTHTHWCSHIFTLVFQRNIEHAFRVYLSPLFAWFYCSVPMLDALKYWLFGSSITQSEIRLAYWVLSCFQHELFTGSIILSRLNNNVSPAPSSKFTHLTGMCPSSFKSLCLHCQLQQTDSLNEQS